MSILEILGVFGLAIACIKLGYEIGRNAKKITAQVPKLSGYFLTNF